MIERSVYGSLNGTTTIVTLTASTRTIIRNFSVCNRDSVNVTVTPTFVAQVPWTVILNPGDTVHCDDIYILQAGETMTLVLGAAMTTSDPTYVVTYAEVG